MAKTNPMPLPFSPPPGVVGILIPWFGPALRGGAEMHAFNYAKHLHAAGTQVEVLTTTSESFLSVWHHNFYPEGVDVIDGITVRRFTVDPRDEGAFGAVNVQMLNHRSEISRLTSPVDREAERRFLADGITSQSMLAYLRAERDRFCFVLGLPYLFGFVVDAMRVMGNKAVLVPCLHDEPYAYLGAVREMFAEVSGLFFNSRGEQQLAIDLYGDALLSKSFVTGGGVERDRSGDLASEWQNLVVAPKLKALEPGTYLLYVGRRSVEKNTGFLVQNFAKVLHRLPANAKLILVGPGECDPAWQELLGERLIDCGLVGQATKSHLMQNSRALVNPSVNESFSRVLYEAWLEETPVVVHSECLATMGTLEDAGYAGFSADDDGFGDALVAVFSTPEDQLKSLGRKGRSFAETHASWPAAIRRLHGALSSLAAFSEPPLQRTVQAWSNLWFADPGTCQKSVKKSVVVIDPSGQVPPWLTQIKGYAFFAVTLELPGETRPRFSALPTNAGVYTISDWDAAATALVLAEAVVILGSHADWLRLAWILEQPVLTDENAEITDASLSAWLASRPRFIRPSPAEIRRQFYHRPAASRQV